MKIVVLSPHRDDAAFSLSLAIEAWINRGFNVDVVNCFTRSEYAPFSDVDSIHPNDRLSYVTALRSREDDTWSRRFGSKLKLTNLNLKDAPLRLRCSVDDVCKLEVSPAEKAFVKIRTFFDRSQEDAFVLPLALGAHVDHATARDAALAAVSPSTCIAFYEDLPYAARPGAAESIDNAVRKMSLALTPAFMEPARDVRESCVRSRRAALCYDSQINDEVADDISRFCSRYEGRERLWVNNSWRNSVMMTKGWSPSVGAS